MGRVTDMQDRIAHAALAWSHSIGEGSFPHSGTKLRRRRSRQAIDLIARTALCAESDNCSQQTLVDLQIEAKANWYKLQLTLQNIHNNV